MIFFILPRWEMEACWDSNYVFPSKPVLLDAGAFLLALTLFFPSLSFPRSVFRTFWAQNPIAGPARRVTALFAALDQRFI